MIGALALWALTAYTAADVARCESGHAFDDGAVVLQTALNRVKRWRRPLLVVLTAPGQFADGCPITPRTWAWQHVALGALTASGVGAAPAWADAALFYCGPSDAPGACHERRLGPVGEVVHTFYRCSIRRPG